jgi:oligoendopeptidase F
MTEPTRRQLMRAIAALASSTGLPLSAFAAATETAPPTSAGAAWDLKDIFPSDEAWTTERNAVIAVLPSLQAWSGKLGDGAPTMLKALAAISDVNRRTDKLALYAGLSADADTRVAATQERRQLAIDLATQVQSASSWVRPEVLRLGADKIAAFEAAEPGLAPFRYQLKTILRLGPHTLGGEAEGVLAAAATMEESPEQIRTQLVLSDVPWREVTFSTGKATVDNQGFTQHRDSAVREDRKAAFDALFGEYGQFRSSLGAALTAEVQAHDFQARSRHFDGALDSALSGFNIPSSVYRTLIAECHAGLPQLHRYFDIRRRLLGLEQLAYYDLYPPVTRIDRTFTLPEMRTLTLEAVKPLGPDYVKTLSDATAAKWMDPLPRKGKASGAYENSVWGVHPYVLLNLTPNYDGLTTYAHEWGHAMHSVLANAAQTYETSTYPTFLAEIASTNNEQLLSHLMTSTAKTRAERMFYLDQLVELFRTTFFRQTMFAEFELAIHETAERGEGLSGDKFSEIYLKILKTYHGDGVVIDDAYAMEWAYIPHFYYNFYVYQYATSLAASAYFSDKVLAEGAKARDVYLGVLKAGGSNDPVEVLKRAGLDMTTPTPYRALVAKFTRTLDALEAEMAKPA